MIRFLMFILLSVTGGYWHCSSQAPKHQATPLIYVAKFTCNFFKFSLNAICSKLFGKQNLNLIVFPQYMNLRFRKIF